MPGPRLLRSCSSDRRSKIAELLPGGGPARRGSCPARGATRRGAPAHRSAGRPSRPGETLALTRGCRPIARVSAPEHATFRPEARRGSRIVVEVLANGKLTGVSGRWRRAANTAGPNCARTACSACRAVSSSRPVAGTVVGPPRLRSTRPSSRRRVLLTVRSRLRPRLRETLSRHLRRTRCRTRRRRPLLPLLRRHRPLRRRHRPRPGSRRPRPSRRPRLPPLLLRIQRFPRRRSRRSRLPPQILRPRRPSRTFRQPVHPHPHPRQQPPRQQPPRPYTPRPSHGPRKQRARPRPTRTPPRGMPTARPPPRPRPPLSP